jgi:hypothetical protein
MTTPPDDTVPNTIPKEAFLPVAVAEIPENGTISSSSLVRPVRAPAPVLVPVGA